MSIDATLRTDFRFVSNQVQRDIENYAQTHTQPFISIVLRTHKINDCRVNKN